MATRADILRVARSWLGVPFAHQGRTRRGVDCVGLVVMVARELGISDYDFTRYERRPDGSFLTHFRANATERARVADARPGDLMVLADSLYPCHVAIRAEQRGEPTLIHALAAPPYRRVCETLYAPDAPRVRFAFVLPGVED